EILDLQVRRDDRWQTRVVSVIEELVDLLVCPGGGALGPQIVEDEELGGPDLLEELIVADRAARTIGGAEMVQEVRNGDEGGGAVVGDARVGDRGRQVRLPAAISALEHEPPVRIPREEVRRLVGGAERRRLRGRQPSALGGERREGHMAK